ncbi:MAG TPA: hypothetical protein VGK21_17090, partial [Candidatus Angelobacter sp.]
MGSSSRSIIRILVLALAFAAVTLAQQNAAPAGGEPATAPQAGAPTPAQTQPQVEGTAAVLKVKTRLVVVDVIALDHKGVPVADLKADDFILQEENKP